MTKKSWIIKDLLSVSIDFLKEKNIESPRLCAEILLAHQLHTDRLKLYLDYDQPVGEKDLNLYRSMIKRLIEGEPSQYITGIQEFWSMDFTVNRNVLIPRPETEIIVEQCIGIFREEYEDVRPDIEILDMGTGSGAIAVALASEIGTAKISASDISDSALETAETNAEKHSVKNAIRFLHGNLFEPFEMNHHVFDIIVSNPPYVKTEEYESLPGKIKNFEPKIALESGKDGLSHIRKILENAPGFLRPGGWLILEMDPRQTLETSRIINENSSYTFCRVIKDYSNRDRVVLARKSNEQYPKPC